MATPIRCCDSLLIPDEGPPAENLVQRVGATLNVSMKLFYKIAFAAFGIGAVAVACTQEPAQWLRFFFVLIGGAALTQVFRQESPGSGSPPTQVLPETFVASGIDFAWSACERFVDSQLAYIERLDVKLGIVIAGLVGAAGVFLDRAHGPFAMALGSVALVALIFAVVGFLIGRYEDAPSPRSAASTSNEIAYVTKAALIESFITSSDANQVVIFRKGRCLDLAAIIISAVVVIAMLGKVYSDVAGESTGEKRNAPSSSAARLRSGNSKPSGSSWIGHPFTHEN